MFGGVAQAYLRWLFYLRDLPLPGSDWVGEHNSGNGRYSLTDGISNCQSYKGEKNLGFM